MYWAVMSYARSLERQIRGRVDTALCCSESVADFTAVPVPEQPQKAKASKLCKKARKVASASVPGVSPPRKQRRLGWKPVNKLAKQGAGQNVSASQVASSHTSTAAEAAASQIPDSSQLNTSFTDRLRDANMFVIIIISITVVINI